MRYEQPIFSLDPNRRGRRGISPRSASTVVSLPNALGFGLEAPLEPRVRRIEAGLGDRAAYLALCPLSGSALQAMNLYGEGSPVDIRVPLSPRPLSSTSARHRL